MEYLRVSTRQRGANRAIIRAGNRNHNNIKKIR